MPYKHWTDEEVNKIRARKLHFSIQEIADNFGLTPGQVCYALYRYGFEKKSTPSLKIKPTFSGSEPPKCFWTWVSEIMGFKK